MELLRLQRNDDSPEKILFQLQPGKHSLHRNCILLSFLSLMRKFGCLNDQKRKCGLPPRPVRRRMRKPARKKDESGPAMSPSSSTAVAAPNSASSSILGVGPPSVNHTATPATVGIGSPVESNTCSICQGVRDGAFVHGRRAHVVYCFSCTERISRKPGARCPICRLTIQKSLKLFISWSFNIYLYIIRVASCRCTLWSGIQIYAFWALRNPIPLCA